MKTLFSAFIIFIATASVLSAQKLTTVGYDSGHDDPLYSWELKKIGDEFSHQQNNWGFAVKFDLRDFGVNVAKDNFDATAVRLNFYVNAGNGKRSFNAFLAPDFNGRPDSAKAIYLSMTINHKSTEYDTAVTLQLTPTQSQQFKKINPLWLGFYDAPDTTNKLYTWLRCGWLPWAPNRSYERLPGRDWSLIDEPVIGGGILRNGTNLYFQIVYDSISTDVATPNQATDFTLYQNYPNPFNPITNFYYTLSHASKVSLTIYDIYGREVANVIDCEQESGTYTQPFVANLPAGMYYYRLTTTAGMQIKRLIVTK